MSTLTIELNEELVQEYQTMSERDRLDIRTMLADAIQRKRKRTLQDMFDLSDKMSAEAAANGLNEDVVAEILNENEIEATSKEPEITWQHFFDRTERLGKIAEEKGLTDDVLQNILDEIKAERQRP